MSIPFLLVSSTLLTPTPIALPNLPRPRKQSEIKRSVRAPTPSCLLPLSSSIFCGVLARPLALKYSQWRQVPIEPCLYCAAGVSLAIALVRLYRALRGHSTSKLPDIQSELKLQVQAIIAVAHASDHALADQLRRARKTSPSQISLDRFAVIVQQLQDVWTVLEHELDALVQNASAEVKAELQTLIAMYAQQSTPVPESEDTWASRIEKSDAPLTPRAAGRRQRSPNKGTPVRANTVTASPSRLGPLKRRPASTSMLDSPRDSPFVQKTLSNSFSAGSPPGSPLRRRPSPSPPPTTPFAGLAQNRSAAALARRRALCYLVATPYDTQDSASRLLTILKTCHASLSQALVTLQDMQFDTGVQIGYAPGTSSRGKFTETCTAVRSNINSLQGSLSTLDPDAPDALQDLDTIRTKVSQMLRDIAAAQDWVRKMHPDRVPSRPPRRPLTDEFDGEVTTAAAPSQRLPSLQTRNDIHSGSLIDHSLADFNIQNGIKREAREATEQPSMLDSSPFKNLERMDFDVFEGEGEASRTLTGQPLDLRELTNINPTIPRLTLDKRAASASMMQELSSVLAGVQQGMHDENRPLTPR